jgi:sterol desaturase/sphingolipid hydroxylase (fatty acid hydroxylase superfamily)
VRLSESEVQLVRGLAPLAAFALGLVLERMAPHAALRPAWRANLGLWCLGAMLMAAVCGACGWTVAAWAQASGVGLSNAVHAPLGAGIAATIVVLDLVSYVWHRANHEVGFLWRFHRVHHADADYHVSTALRFHPGELLLALPVRLAAVAVLGAPPVAVVIFEVIFGIANVLEHGNFDLPRRFEEAISVALVTPALHRRHHSTERSERDSNFGTILCLWDRLAQTLTPSTSAAVFPTGLPGRTGSGARSLSAMLFAPIRSRANRT